MNARFIFLRRRRQKKSSHRSQPVFLRLTLGGLALMVGLIITAVGASAAATVGIYNYYAKDLPEPGAIVTQTQQQFKTTRIYDRTGTVVLYEIIDPQGGSRTVVPLTRIPDNCKNATVALEDRNFWTNPGFDWYGIARAAVNNVLGGRLQGASSITQQLVKNVLIAPEERTQASIGRKIKEVILASEISRKYDKTRILEWYMNGNYYGNLSYGIQAAAEAYFGKQIQDLDLNECATLAAIPQFPALNPIDDPQAALDRRNIVLDQLYLQGYITADQALATKAAKLRIAPKRFDIRAPHFVFYIRRQLEEMYGPAVLYRGGLKVYTTLDYNQQQIAEQVARDQIAKLQVDKKNVNDASIVVIKPSTGEIMAMVGSVDYFNRDIDGQVNVSLSPRQPGSTFKIFNYLTAFAQGFAPATTLMDVRTVFDDWPNPPYVPENYDRKYHDGPVRLRTALASSYNIPAVKLLSLVGIKNVVNTAHRMGINTLDREKFGLALTLGGGEVTLLDMTYAMSVLANGGAMAGQAVPKDKLKPGFRALDPISILKVVDANDKTIFETKPADPQRIVTPQLAYLMSDVLADNNARAPAFGVNSVLKLSRPTAVKTGTTSDWRDNWTVGWTPDYVTGVWVGNADNAEMEHISGVAGAGPIWHDVMEKIHQGMPVRSFADPGGLVRVEVCVTSGLLPTPYCPDRVKEVFIAGTEPKTYDNIWQPFRIYKPNGKLATVYDPDQVEEKVFPIYPPEAADWVTENKIPQPPTEYDSTFRSPSQSSDVAIISPASYSGVKGQLTIVGNARIDNLDVYRLTFGKGIDPTQWTQIGGDHRDKVDNGALEHWDVTSLDGLYTLKLTVVDKTGKPREAAVQVMVDNQPPTVKIIHPSNGDIYSPEKDEWVSIGVDAVDNTSMGRTEFYVDGQFIGSTTVAPYNKKWNIKMMDTLTPTLRSSAIVTPTKFITLTRTYQNADNQPISEQIGAQVTRTTGAVPSFSVAFTTGLVLVSYTLPLSNTNAPGFVESHIIKVVAVDAAGNRTESAPVSIFVQHQIKEKK